MKIINILGCTNHDTFATIHVLLDDGMEGVVWVGGEVEAFYHKEKIKVFVKRNKLDKDNAVGVE